MLVYGFFGHVLAEGLGIHIGVVWGCVGQVIVCFLHSSWVNP